jgi:DNA-binding GntR family transcriptional regulator
VPSSSRSARALKRRRNGRQARADIVAPSAKSSVTVPTKTNLVYTDLRSRILSGNLEPGTRLVIRKIAERHNVSDIPVREALRLLEKDNLIESHPYGSSFVRQTGDEEVSEIFFIRGLLESAATQLCVNFLTGVTLRKLEVLCEKMETCTGKRDVDEYARLNREFHRTIFSTLPFTKLTDQIEQLWQSYGWLQLTFRHQPGRMAESNIEHRTIVDALRERSGAAAARAAFVHKQNARRAFIAARYKGPGKSARASVKDAPDVEEIEVLSDLWQEAQWPASKDGRTSFASRSASSRLKGR